MKFCPPRYTFFQRHRPGAQNDGSSTPVPPGWLKIPSEKLKYFRSGDVSSDEKEGKEKEKTKERKGGKIKLTHFVAELVFFPFNKKMGTIVDLVIPHYLNEM